MRVLLIKTSSMGDIVHTLPAITDAKSAIPNIKFDWLIEDAFAEIPVWHPAVDEVIPISLRRWRKQLLSKKSRDEWHMLRSHLAPKHYDYILDAQGLIKSALLTLLVKAKGKRVGLDWHSAREFLASLAYQKKCKVNFKQHAVVRMRCLFNQALDYPIADKRANFGINRSIFMKQRTESSYLVFLHSTTWKSKQWPEAYWVRLAELAGKGGYRVIVSGGNEEELKRANRMAEHSRVITALTKQSISNTANLLANASGVVAIDTGFAHLAGALNVPTLSLYGSTNPEFTGVMGDHARNLSVSYPCSPCLKRECRYKRNVTIPPCYTSLPPEYVWEQLKILMQAQINDELAGMK